MLLTLLSGVVNGYTIYLLFGYLQYLTTNLFEDYTINAIYIFIDHYWNINFNIFFFLIILLTFTLKIILTSIYFNTSEKFRIDVSYFLAQKRAFSQSDISNKVSDLTNHLTKADTFNDLLMSLTLQLSTNIFSIIILFTIDFKLSLISLLVIFPIVYFSNKLISNRVLYNVSKYNDHLNNYTNFLVVNQYNLASDLIIFNEFTIFNKKIKRLQLNITKARFFSNLYFEIIFFLYVLIILLMDIDSKVVYLGVLVKIITNFQSLIQHNQKVQIRFESFKRFFS
jgi:hypothetical protein